MQKQLIKGCAIVFALLALVPALLGAYSDPELFPLKDEPVLKMDVSKIDIAFGMISQDVTIANPTGRMKNRQILRIELASKVPQRLTWGDQFQPRHSLRRLPTHTTGADATTGEPVLDQFIFEYVEPLRVWSFIGTTQPVFVSAPSATR